jgi:hypothetical protein
LILLWAPAPDWRQAAAFALLWIWPAVGLYQWQHGPAVERWLTAAGLALTLNAGLALILSLLPLPLNRWSLLAVPLTLTVASLLAKRGETHPNFDWEACRFLIPALLAGALRLPALGYKEFQGDEVTILTRAATALMGDGQILFLHQKGPLEILLPLAQWGLAGNLNEFWARLVFTWASALSVLAVTALARRWFNDKAALWTGLLLALAGMSLAFGRIVQYQSFVMLLTTLALLHAVRYQGKQRPGDLLLVALFLAAGLLAHYDAVLFAPAVITILLGTLLRHWQAVWPVWLTASVLGIFVLGLFYLPFVTNPNFAATGSYLLHDRVGTSNGVFSWSGPIIWQMLTLYNSLYYTVGVGLLSGAGVWAVWRQRGPIGPLFHVGAPLFFYAFIVVDPRTHVYTVLPGGAILAGAGLVFLWSAWSKPAFIWRRWMLGTAVSLLILLSLTYLFLIYLDYRVERQRTWAENWPGIFVNTWDEPPLYGLFGFPYQAGWRLVPDLLTEADLPYASNEKMEVTRWYMAHAPRTHCPNFQTFILAENTQDSIPYDPAWLANLRPVYEVTVNGRQTMTIYSRRPAPELIRAEAAGQRRWRSPAEMALPQYGGGRRLDYTLGAEQVRLLGYDLDDSRAYPGGEIVVTLYWQALAPFAQNYQTFTHLFDGEMWGQHDGAPECAINPTTRWEPGQIVADPHIMPIRPDTPSGSIPLLTGMYALIGYERLSVMELGGNVIHLTDVVIKAHD